MFIGGATLATGIKMVVLAIHFSEIHVGNLIP